MDKKTVAASVAAVAASAVLAAAAWHWGPAGPSVASLTSAVAGKGGKGGTGETLRKCRLGTQIEYTNGPCPAGTREEGVGAGTLSVLPAAPLPPAPATSAATPALRELAPSVDPRDMQERAIDRAIGR